MLSHSAKLVTGAIEMLIVVSLETENVIKRNSNLSPNSKHCSLSLKAILGISTGGKVPAIEPNLIAVLNH